MLGADINVKVENSTILKIVLGAILIFLAWAIIKKWAK